MHVVGTGNGATFNMQVRENSMKKTKNGRGGFTKEGRKTIKRENKNTD